jgi:hypothetical protein
LEIGVDSDTSAVTPSQGRGKSEGSRATQFKPGNELHKRRKNVGARGSGQRPQVLRDMRHVYQSPREKDVSEGQRICRELLENDRDKFIGRLTALEKAYLQSKAKVAQEEAEPEEEKDEGTELALDLIGNLLKQRETERAQEDAEFAKRSDAAQLGATLQQKLRASLDREERLRQRVEELEREQQEGATRA